jgi:hypothetical protein
MNESYDFIIEEMLVDLKEILLLESKNNIEYSIAILETFYNIKHGNDILTELSSLENILTEGTTEDISKTINSIKSNFNKKHEKIIQRDKSWLGKNKKSIMALNFEEIQIEVVSDYKTTFEQLLNRHNIFDKIFINSSNMENLDEKLSRFEDKNGNLKNGLDNYFRTGTSRREVGLRKLSGEEAKSAIEFMIAYCESFLAGRKFLEEKLNNIILSASEQPAEEMYSPIDILREAIEKDEKEEDIGAKAEEDLKNLDLGEENKTEEDVEEPTDEEPKPDGANLERGLKDRQVGIAVLLTVAEERYFDYINILKGLKE